MGSGTLHHHHHPQDPGLDAVPQLRAHRRRVQRLGGGEPHPSGLSQTPGAGLPSSLMLLTHRLRSLQLLPPLTQSGFGVLFSLIWEVSFIVTLSSGCSGGVVVGGDCCLFALILCAVWRPEIINCAVFIIVFLKPPPP